MAKALWGNGAGGLDYKELRWKMRGQVSQWNVRWRYLATHLMTIFMKKKEGIKRWIFFRKICS